jgi:hypothetical protein
MRTRLLAAALLLPLGGAAGAQTNEALAQVVDGWARGRCDALTQLAENPQTGAWVNTTSTPYTTWSIRKVGPQTIEYTMAGGLARRITLADGTYRDHATDSTLAFDPLATEWSILEHGITAPDNWRLFMRHPPVPGEPEGNRTYSELIVAGDVFVWTNWSEENGGPRQRVMYYVCKFTEL